MKHLLFTLIALIVAGNAMANSYLFVDDFNVNSNQSTVTVPIKAHFNGRVSGFQVDVTYPQGLTPAEVENGADMTINYVGRDGSSQTQEVSFFQYNESLTRFMAVFCTDGYWDPDEDGTYERYGVIKWEAGEYDQMFYLTLNVDESFQGGDIIVQSEVAAGDDARGGTVSDLGEDELTTSMTCHVERVVLLTPEPEITCENVGGAWEVRAIGEGIVHLYLWGEEVENPYIVPQSYTAQTYEFAATAQIEGYAMSSMVYYTLDDPGLEKQEVAAPVLDYNITDDCVVFNVFWPYSDGERVLIINGSYFDCSSDDDYTWTGTFSRQNEVTTYDIEAYVLEGSAFKESAHATRTVIVPPLNDDPVNPVEDYSLTIADAEVLHGRTVVIPVSMTNVTAVTAFQTDLYLPEGFVLQQIEGTNRMVDHLISKNTMADGSVRILCYSPSLMQLNGNDGVLFNITVQVPDDAAGDYALYLKNSRLSIAEGGNYNEIRCADDAGNLNVWAFILGDANDDGVVDVSDVVATAQYILGYNPNPFNPDAADMNGDGEITVTDAVLITRKALDPTMVDLDMLRAPVVRANNDAMSAEDLHMAAGETRTVTIALDNDVDYTAFQLDVQLPAGLTASNFSVTDRAGSHAFSTSQVDGKQRVMCYSPVLATIDGNEGALITFDVTANGYVSGEITVDGIEMVTAACGTVYLDSFAIGVNSEGLTAVKDIAGDLRIYVEGHDIIVESPVSQEVVISDMAGRSYSVNVTEGRNVIPARFDGVIVVAAGDKTAKFMMK